MTEAFISRLQQAKAEYDGVLGGVIGGILGIMIEFNGLARDESVRYWEQHRKLKDRLKDLENKVDPPVDDGTGSNGGVVPPLPVPQGPGTAHDYGLTTSDLGSNNAVTGTFAINTTVFAGNAANTTGTGVGSTIQFMNLAQSDKQTVGGHKISLRAAGTPGTPAVNAPIKLFSANFVSSFDRTPAVKVVPLDPNGASLTLYVDPSQSGYSVYAVGGTLTANQSYGFQIVVQPS